MLLLCGPVYAADFVGGGALQPLITFPTREVQRAVLQRRPHSAAWFDRVLAVAKFATRGDGRDVRECGSQSVRGVPGLDFAHARRIDDDRAIGSDEQFALSCGVTAF